MLFCLCSVTWGEINVRFVDIGLIVDHHCLIFLFINDDSITMRNPLRQSKTLNGQLDSNVQQKH